MDKLTGFLSGMRILEEVESPINGKLTVIRDLTFGTYIHGGGIPQSGGLAQSIWKKPLKNVHQSPVTVHQSLILGLGGGGIAKLVRKNWPDAKITGVDIDPVIIDLGKKYMGLAKLDVDIKIQDAYEFCTNQSLVTNHYDLICVDLYIGQEYPKKFETEKFIKSINRLIGSGGVAVFNRLYYDQKRTPAVKFLKLLEKIFPKVEVVYPEANIMFICSN